MEAALFQGRCQAQWHPEQGAASPDFWILVAQRRASLQQWPHPQPTVLIAEADPVQFLAAWVAAVDEGCPVVLGNPRWSVGEWHTVFTQIHPDLVWGRVPEAAWATPPPAEKPQPGWILIPTGGSSGQIRFAIHTWETLLAATRGFHAYLLGPVEEGWQPIHCCCVLPVYHVSGLMQFVRAFVSGGRLAIAPFTEIMAHQLPALDPSTAFLSLVPTQLQRLLADPALTQWLGQFPTIFLGGGPAWESLLYRARQQGIRLAPTYGMTETAAQVATLKPQAFLDGQSGCGSPLPHAQIAIQDTQGQKLGVSEIGTITIRSPALFLGYYPPTQPPPTELTTDDLGYLSPTDNLHVVGRNSRKIITGGENVYPEEVEAALYATGWVEDVYVTGLPDPDWGEIVTAFYVPRDPSLTGVQLAAALESRLSRYKHPKRWVPLPALPRNPQGKLSEPAMLQALAQELNEEALPPTQTSRAATS